MEEPQDLPCEECLADDDNLCEHCKFSDEDEDTKEIRR